MPPLTRPFTADPQPVARFSIQAAADPGLMPRVLELFAKRGLVPSSWRSAVVNDAALAIEIRMQGLSREHMHYVAQCMRQIVGVETVLASEVGAAAVESTG